MSRTRRSILIVIPMLVALERPAMARQEAPTGQLRVFLECPSCDFDFVRTEIAYVDWMRDRADAELHVLARTQTTGSGGRLHTLDFIGLQRHVGRSDTLSYVSGRDDTPDTTRRGLSRILKIGLMRYVADTPVADRIQITMPQATGGSAAAAAAPQRDPWNAWVFTVGGSGNSNGESSRTQLNISTNLGANRVTAAWKMNYAVRGSYGRQSFTYAIANGARDTTVTSITRSYNGSALIVRSLNGHASFGGRMEIGTSTFGNTEFFVNVEPAFEYNLFPYAESTRRQLVLRYGAGMISQSYREETVYFRMEETRAVHSLMASFSTRQTWGSLNFGIDGQQYFHDTSLYNLVFSGNTSVNITRGLSINFGGNYALVRDQISLARRNLTPEEVLLRQRQVATSYRYFGNVGFSYRFGSAVQNVVNPRFGAGGGGIVIFN
jgi:hypothetical protein